MTETGNPKQLPVELLRELKDVALDARTLLVHLKTNDTNRISVPEGFLAVPALPAIDEGTMATGVLGLEPKPKRSSRRKPEASAEGAELVPMDLEHVAKINDLADLCAFSQSCRACKLCRTRHSVVFGQGAKEASVMFIGEGPGANEDRTGEPFVGRAGKLLTRMLNAAGIDREEVFITNIVKCRPPGNRDPEPDEVLACRPLLERQVELIKPAIIATLGRPAVQSILGSDVALGRLRGHLYEFHSVPLIPTYHPAFLLRRPEYKGKAWADLKTIVQWLVDQKIREPLPKPWWSH